MRQPVAQKTRNQSRMASLPAPTRGWIANENLALARPAGAQILENWFPTETSLRARGGSRVYATLTGYTFSRASTAAYYTATGTIATATNDVIRKNINPATGVDSGFLIEAAATNLLTQSAAFDDASWPKNDTTVTANATIAPDGATTADKLVEAATSAEHKIRKNSVAVSADADYTFSCYMKAAERTYGGLYFSTNTGSTSAITKFDLVNGTVVSAPANVVAGIEKIGNGWFRCRIKYHTAVGSTAASLILYALTSASNSIYLGDGTSGIYLWGAQLETGSAATSYIPTIAAAATRAADVYAAVDPIPPVQRLWTYKSGETEQFFGSDQTHIFEITSVADPEIIPAPVVTGQTSGYYSTAQFGNAGGDFLSACNGTDTPQLYDGSAWAAHSFTGLATPQELSFVWSYASRLWYVRKNTMEAYYLPVDNINGALSLFSLQGVFQEGGALLFGGKWSQDSGSGLNDVCLFVSDRGEVAVYQGIDPSNASTWSKVGLYKITPPLGPNAWVQVGGDLLVATEDGLIPISQAVNKDIAALSIAAISVPIGPEWKKEVTARRTLPWEIMKWPEFNMAVVSLPVPDDQIAAYCFVANIQTGAWAKYTGWNTRCLCRYANFGFFGTNDGTVMQMEVGGNDNGQPYVCTYVGLPENFGLRGVTKIVHSARSSFLASVPFKAKISASANYQITLPTPPNAVDDFVTDNWDEGLWDVAKWDGGTLSTITTTWTSIGKTGFAISPQIQMTCGVTPYPRIELISYDIIYEPGGVMV